MFVGIAEFDVLFGDVHSLKAKRGLVRPLVAELQRKWNVTAAEAGMNDLHRRSLIGVAVVADSATHCNDVLDNVERTVASRPELELLSVRRRLVGPHDE